MFQGGRIHHHYFPLPPSIPLHSPKHSIKSNPPSHHLMWRIQSSNAHTSTLRPTFRIYLFSSLSPAQQNPFMGIKLLGILHYYFSQTSIFRERRDVGNTRFRGRHDSFHYPRYYSGFLVNEMLIRSINWGIGAVWQRGVLLYNCAVGAIRAVLCWCKHSISEYWFAVDFAENSIDIFSRIAALKREERRRSRTRPLFMTNRYVTKEQNWWIEDARWSQSSMCRCNCASPGH